MPPSAAGTTKVSEVSYLHCIWWLVTTIITFKQKEGGGGSLPDMKRKEMQPVLGMLPLANLLHSGLQNRSPSGAHEVSYAKGGPIGGEGNDMQSP